MVQIILERLVAMRASRESSEKTSPLTSVVVWVSKSFHQSHSLHSDHLHDLLLWSKYCIQGQVVPSASGTPSLHCTYDWHQPSQGTAILSSPLHLFVGGTR